MKKNFSFLFFLIFTSLMFGQNCPEFSLVSEIPSSCNEIVMTMLHDQQARPYLYVANKEAGLKIFKIINSEEPEFVTSIENEMWEELHVMNLTQEADYLFLALGNHFTNPQIGGIAIIDISDPEEPKLMDFETIPGAENGIGVVRIEHSLAYVGSMKNGVVVYDFSNPFEMNLVGQFIPDIDYPVSNPANEDLYNARGMVVLDSTVYLCYDAGGLRIIDFTDLNNPEEIGRYANPSSYEPFNRPRAYNNVILEFPFAYVAVDYCGVEILNISNPENITLAGWWNPYGCPDNNWFTSPSHTNELYYLPECKQLFVSTGKSDLIVLDVSDPETPDSCAFYGGIDNGIGTWAVSGFQNQIYLSYICAFIPFTSNWTGVKILNFNLCDALSINEVEDENIQVYPNPSNGIINFSRSASFNTTISISIYESNGKLSRKVETNDALISLDLRDLPMGMKFYRLENMETQRVISEGKFVLLKD